MAVRKPLKPGPFGFQTMSQAEINNLILRAVYNFSLNPAVSLSRVNSGGSLGSIFDTRVLAGAYSTRTDRFPTEAETADVTTTSITFNKIDETVTPTAKPTKLLPPLAYASGYSIRAMREVDYYDTIIHPAIDLLTSGDLTPSQAGTHFISTSTSIPGATLVDSNPIFTDTRSNASLYTADAIPETLDQPEIVQSYYLHVIDGAPIDIIAPMAVLNTGQMRQYSLADFDTYLSNAINYSVSQEPGWQLRYSYTNGLNRGTAMLDSKLDSSTYRTLFVDEYDYRAQEHPDGSSTVINTYYLKISKT